MVYHLMNKKSYIACPYCDALYDNVVLSANEVLVCHDCHAVIDNGKADFVRSFIFALTALILFIISNTFAFITINLKGEESTITVFSSIKSLFENDLTILGFLVLLLIIVMPLWYLLAMVWVGISFYFDFSTQLTRRFLHWMEHLAPWNMLDVYLAGVVVTMVKILTLADIEFEAAFWAFCLLMVCNYFANHYFHLDDAIFKAYEHK